MNYEQEEEYLTNDLSRKLAQVRDDITLSICVCFQSPPSSPSANFSPPPPPPPFLPQLKREKVQLEQTLEQEQEQQISKLTKKIGRLEKDVLGKQSTLEKVCPISPYINSLL